VERIKFRYLGLALCLLSLGTPSAALAHKLLVSATVLADGALRVEAFFPDGKPAQEVPVSVIAEAGQSTFAAKTDLEGRAVFAPLAPGTYRLEVGDPLGHRAETRVVIAGTAGGAAGAAGATSGASPPAASPGRGESLPWGNLLSGLGFIFGLAAFLMALQLRREVRNRAPRD
jgi:hypothetical protein